MTSFRNNSEVNDALGRAEWFYKDGAYVLVDGQFGSTGKGLLSSVLGEYGADMINTITSNAGPNSGHTAYSPVNGEKIMTQQVPVSSVVIREIMKSSGTGYEPSTYLNGGAVIDPDIFYDEVNRHNLKNVFVHPHASLIEQEHIDAEKTGGPSKIAGTAKGVGAAIASRVMRENKGFGEFNGPQTVGSKAVCEVRTSEYFKYETVFIETSQGFSLGINAGFYPHCTSRECTVAQALSDARISPRALRKVAACYRTYPIRVGNTAEGNSGPSYQDQQETTWEAIGVEPELTTVTKRVRRVFTWSWTQFVDSIVVNDPDLVFINFLQYVKKEDRIKFLDQVVETYMDVMNKPLELLLVGYGPNNGDVMVYEKSRVWSRNPAGELECFAP